ncbi:MAG: hypothetical protein ACJASR_001936 [Psychroserpens sp.]|jgi:hypothetical protein
MFPLLNTLFFISELGLLNAESNLSKSQVCWLGFVLSAIIVSNTICWAVFESISNKKHKSTKLMGMFRRAKLPWDKLMIASIHLILKRYKLRDGVLLLDDSDKDRSKNVTKIHAAYKVNNKKKKCKLRLRPEF